IPPRFDFLGSSNLVDFSINWPAPVVFDQSGMTSVGYKDVVILPIKLFPKNPNRDVRLRGTIDIGVCKDICLPITLDINAKLESDETKKSPVIGAALASIPFTEEEAGVQSAVCKLSTDGGSLIVSTTVEMPSAGGEEYVIIESVNDDHWLSEAKTSRKGNALTSQSALVSLSGGAVAINRSDIRITILGRDHAVDVQGCTGG
ncbi:MAG: protein-disulfide reductase DsbD family protein, partial [Paracoccaceae bacterium]|nr:protein-disulfide reductase DsbD family protein [Paracoccaceae bacterium]